MCLFKWIRGPGSENPFAVNAWTSPKNSWNLQKSTFIRPFHQSGPNWVRKSYFESALKFQDCLLTGWLPTTSILVVIERIYRCQSKSNYLKHHKFFSLIFVAILESTFNFQCSETSMSLIDHVFLKLLTPKDVFM